jgi:hypothetical protein
MIDMAIPSKRRAPAQGKRSARPASEKPEASAKPFLRFHHSEGLRKKTLLVMTMLEQARDATTHREALAEVVLELTASGLDSYFMKPLRLSNAGFIVQQSASVGLAGVQQVLGTVIRNIIGRMDRPQLLSVCGSIREFML